MSHFPGAAAPAISTRKSAPVGVSAVFNDVRLAFGRDGDHGHRLRGVSASVIVEAEIAFVFSIDQAEATALSPFYSRGCAT